MWKRTMFALLPALVLALLNACADLKTAKDVEITKNGVSAAAIVIADKPTRTAQFGAMELQHHFKLITGAEAPIVKASNAPKDGLKLLVGESELTKKLGFKKEDYTGEEYELKFLPGAIVMIGNDNQNFGAVDYNDSSTWPRTFEPEIASLWAVYDFLEKCCDVHWYAPGEIGITFTPRKTLEVEPLDIRRRPAMDAFRHITTATPITKARNFKFTENDITKLRMRWRLVFRYGGSNHNIGSLYYRYWDKAKSPQFANAFIERHPEYFSQNVPFSAGALSPEIVAEYPDNTPPPQVCDTNPFVHRYFAEEAAEFMKTKKARTGTYVWQPQDIKDAPFFYPIEFNDNQGFCKCAKCVECAKLFLDKDQDYVHCYRRMKFINAIAREAAKIDPKINICCVSYSPVFCAPDMELEPNVGVQLCMNTRCWWHPTVYQRQHGAFLEWVKRAKPHNNMLFGWFYFLDPAWSADVFKYADYFPGMSPQHTAEYFREFTNVGMRGFFAECSMGPFFGWQLDYYVAVRLADDPTLDTDKLIDEFFDHFYGAAAKPMCEFYKVVEDTYTDPKNYPQEWFKDEKNCGPFGRHLGAGSFHTVDVSWGMLGTAERMAKLRGLMDEARRLAATPVEKERLAWFDEEIWQMMERGRKAYEDRQRWMKRPNSSATVPKVDTVDWATIPLMPMKTISGAPCGENVRLQMAHDGKSLHLRYSEPRRAAPLVSTKEIFVGDDGDDIELFFAPKLGVKPYYQLGVSPDGRSFSFAYLHEDANMTDYTEKYDFQEKLRSDASNGWTLTMSIPLEKIPKDGDRFYFNFFRCSYGRLALAWSPTFNNSFHNLERMGALTLGK